jgi:hypothetical protein
MAKKTSTKKAVRKQPAKASTKKPRRRSSSEVNGRQPKPAATEVFELQAELPREVIGVVIEEALELPAAPEFEPDAPAVQRLLPLGEELQNLYARYSAGSTFDDHDKAFYFVLDVGGLSRARQLIDHVEEVLAELEEFRS